MFPLAFARMRHVYSAAYLVATTTVTIYRSLVIFERHVYYICHLVIIYRLPPLQFTVCSKISPVSLEQDRPGRSKRVTQSRNGRRRYWAMRRIKVRRVAVGWLSLVLVAAAKRETAPSHPYPRAPPSATASLLPLFCVSCRLRPALGIRHFHKHGTENGPLRTPLLKERGNGKGGQV